MRMVARLRRRSKQLNCVDDVITGLFGRPRR